MKNHANFNKGTDRFSLIRYWDRRKNRIIKVNLIMVIMELIVKINYFVLFLKNKQTYNASKFDSSIYSLATSPNSIYAAWERGLTIINF